MIQVAAKYIGAWHAHWAAPAPAWALSSETTSPAALRNPSAAPGPVRQPDLWVPVNRRSSLPIALLLLFALGKRHKTDGDGRTSGPQTSTPAVQQGDVCVPAHLVRGSSLLRFTSSSPGWRSLASAVSWRRGNRVEGDAAEANRLKDQSDGVEVLREIAPAGRRPWPTRCCRPAKPTPEPAASSRPHATRGWPRRTATTRCDGQRPGHRDRCRHSHRPAADRYGASAATRSASALASATIASASGFSIALLALVLGQQLGGLLAQVAGFVEFSLDAGAAMVERFDHLLVGTDVDQHADEDDEGDGDPVFRSSKNSIASRT